MPRLNVRTDQRHRIPKSTAEDDNAKVPDSEVKLQATRPRVRSEVTRTAEFEIDKPRRTVPRPTTRPFEFHLM